MPSKCCGKSFLKPCFLFVRKLILAGFARGSLFFYNQYDNYFSFRTSPFSFTVVNCFKKASVFLTRGHTLSQIYLSSHRKKL